MKSGGGEQPGALRVIRRYRAPPERVFDAWLDPEIARLWLFATASRPLAHIDIDARVAGSFRFADRHYGEIIAHTGEYLEILPHRRLAFTLSMANHPEIMTRVTVELVPLEAGCTLILTHERIPPADRKNTKARWTGILYGLGVTLDSYSGPGNPSSRRSAAIRLSAPLRSNP